MKKINSEFLLSVNSLMWDIASSNNMGQIKSDYTLKANTRNMCWFAPIPPTPTCAFFSFSGHLEGHRVTRLWKALSLPPALEREAISLVISLIHAGLECTSHWPFIKSLGSAARVSEGQWEVRCGERTPRGCSKLLWSPFQPRSWKRGHWKTSSPPTTPPQPSTKVSAFRWHMVDMEHLAGSLDIWHCHYLWDLGKNDWATLGRNRSTAVKVEMRRYVSAQ